MLPLTLAGCIYLRAEPRESGSGVPEAAVDVSANLGQAAEYTMFYETRNYRLTKYEPQTGCYLGVAAPFGQGVGQAEKAFDELTLKKHAVAAREMTLGDAFPMDWVTACIARMSTPFLTVEWTDGAGIDAVMELAKACAVFRVPMFVELFPNPAANGFGPNGYKALFARAVDCFGEYAPNAAVVWRASLEDAPDFARFYPGDALVDWVSSRILEEVDENGQYEDIFPALNSFYQTFQKAKPMALWLGVSHYSAADHSYRDWEAAMEIGEVYAEAAEKYLRIKMMIYAEDGGAGRYAVSGGRSVTAAYAVAVEGGWFLSAPDAGGGDMVPQWMKSPFPIVAKNGGLYVSVESLERDLNITGINAPTGYPLEELKKNLFDVEVDGDVVRIRK